MKSLQTDPTARVQRIVDEYRGHPSFPLFYGQLPLPQVIAKLPRDLQEEIRGRVAARVTTALERGFEKGNEQIRCSKDALRVPGTGGLLVALNDEVPIQSPNLLVYRIQQLLSARVPSGEYRFTEFDWVCAISRAHQLQSVDGTWAYPFMAFQGPTSDAGELSRRRWAVWLEQLTDVSHTDIRQLPWLWTRELFWKRKCFRGKARPRVRLLQLLRRDPAAADQEEDPIPGSVLFQSRIPWRRAALR